MNEKTFELVRLLLNGLTDRQREVVLKREGILTNNFLTLDQVGESMGATKQYASQVEKQAHALIKANKEELKDKLI